MDTLEFFFDLIQILFYFGNARDDALNVVGHSISPLKSFSALWWEFFSLIYRLSARLLRSPQVSQEQAYDPAASAVKRVFRRRYYSVLIDIRPGREPVRCYGRSNFS